MKKMIAMGAACEELIARVAKSLLSGDVEGASDAKVHSHEIDRMEREIEAICLKLLLQQQPRLRRSFFRLRLFRER